jgi:hypothetical protein
MNERTHGSLACPYCGLVVAQNVRYMGQGIACPNCRGQFVAPGGNAGTIEGLRLLGSLGTIVIGIVLFELARGC